jgi:hypothetical protein
MIKIIFFGLVISSYIINVILYYKKKVDPITTLKVINIITIVQMIGSAIIGVLQL